MAVKQKYTGKTMSVPAGLAAGTGVSLGLTATAIAILAKLLDMETLAWENIGYGILTALLTSSFLGALTAYSRIKCQRMLVCLLTGAAFFGILLSMTALFFGGQYDGALTAFLLILAGSGCAGLLGLRKGRGERRRKPRIRV